jgi:hypothetical protein
VNTSAHRNGQQLERPAGLNLACALLYLACFLNVDSEGLEILLAENACVVLLLACTFLSGNLARERIEVELGVCTVTPPKCGHERCGGVGWPTCGNPSARWFQFYFTVPLFYVTAFVCIVNSATSSNLTHIPPFPRPVQGSRPEGIRYPFAPSFRKVASGQFSHQYPKIRIAQPHLIHTTFFPLSYSDFPPLSYSTARGRFSYFIRTIHSTTTRITNPKQEPTCRAFSSATVG